MAGKRAAFDIPLLAARVAIWWTGWYRLDAVAALIVTGLMLKTGIGLVLESGRVFLEAAPAGLHPETLEGAIRDVPGVLGVEDLHIWEVTSGMPCVSGDILVGMQSAAPCKRCCTTTTGLSTVRFKPSM